MKVKVIGTGSMWNEYNSASFLIDNDILIDMPNGMCKYLFKMNIDPRVINNVLLTHFHGDHYFDMPFYLLLKSRAMQNQVNIFCSFDGKKKINKLLKLAFPNSKKNVLESLNIHYNNEIDLKVNNYRVTKLLMQHGRMASCYGYLFEDNKKFIGFTGDTTMCDNINLLASKCDYIFCDCMFIKGNNKHMGLDMLEKVASSYPKCHFVVVHLENITREEIKKRKYKNIIVPNDGDVFNI